jgi:endonuclease III
LTVKKLPFDIDIMFRRIEESVAPYPKAALFELWDLGHTSAFEQLVACLISIRTRDETMLPTARRLFEQMKTPAQFAEATVSEIDDLIRESAFHAAKAPNIKAIAQRCVAEFGGALPCNEDVLLSLPGVGPKCANLVLGVACGTKRIGVDIHVHRVTNRWGYVSAPTPELTMVQLEKKLPEKYWVTINRLLVPFGKHICTGKLPKCSACPVLEFCRQVGVTAHR